MKIPEKPPKLTSEHLLEYMEKFVRDETRSLIIEENQEYPYWDKIKYKYKGDAEFTWYGLKIIRRSSMRIVQLQKEAFVFSITEKMHELLHKLDHQLGGFIGSENLISDHVKESVLASSVMEEAISSSILEGAVTTKRAAREMIRKKVKPRNVSEHMVINNYRTQAMLKSISDQKLTIDMIKEIHRSITANTLDSPGLEGQLRKSNDVKVVDVITGDPVFDPPNYGLIDTLLKEFIGWINKDTGPFIHPIVKASVMHFMIGWIHPFVDGNGRTARALFYWYLIKKNYWMIEYTSISSVILKESASYYKAFLYTEQDDNDMGYFIIHSLKTLQKALVDLEKYISKEIGERKGISDLNHLTDLNSRQRTLVHKMSLDPHMRMDTNEYQFRLGVSYETARHDLLTLVDKGYLLMEREGKKKMIFTRGKEFKALLSDAATRYDQQHDLFSD